MSYLAIEVREVDFSELESLRIAARRAGLSFKRTHDTVWFGLYFGGELLGAAGLIWVNKAHTTARLKAAYIDPAWRGQHGYRPLVEARVEYAWEHGAQECMTISRHREIFLRWGWEAEPERPKWLHLYRPEDA